MRNISAPMLAGITSDYIRPALLALLTFRSSTQYVWTGAGDLIFAGNTYRGVGSLGQVGTVTEGSEVHADGTSVTLSGIDPALLSASLDDIQVGAPAFIYFALVDTSNNLIGTPYTLFRGQVDKPTVVPDMDRLSITLALETRLANLQRATMRRYTAADQHLAFPDDIAFNWVETLNDAAFRWGM